MTEDWLTPSEKAERLKAIMMARAMGMSNAADPEYRELRAEFIDNPSTRDLLPRMVRIPGSTEEFFRAIQSRFGGYGERRAYIAEEMQPCSTTWRASLLPRHSLSLTF